MITLTLYCPNCDVSIPNVEYSPGTAPKVSGPPEHCDPGDSPELQFPNAFIFIADIPICKSCYKPMDVDTLYEQAEIIAQDMGFDPPEEDY